MINIVLDATSLDTLQSCPTKFNYRFNLNKVTVEKAKPLDQGGVVHIGAEAYWNALKKNQPWDKAVSDMLSDIRKSLMDSELTTEEGNHTLDVMEENAAFWKHEDLTFEVLGVEEPFAYELYKDDTFRIVMIGKIDLRISNMRYKNVPYDHKTFSRDFPLNSIANQFTNYAKAIDSPYLFVNRIGFQKTVKPKDKFKRIPLSFDHFKFKQWTDNTIKWAMQYYDYIQSNDWPMNQTSCDKYNRICEYMPVCESSGLEAKNFKLNMVYKTGEKWDVSKVLTARG